MAALRWLTRNFGTLLTAFALAVIVWVSSVISSDPNEEQILGRAIPIEIIGQAPGIQIMDEYDSSLSLTLMAPSSVWTQLINDPGSVRAWIDLTGLEAGTHIVPVQVQIAPRLVRMIRQEPEELTIVIEEVITQIFPVTLVVNGDPPQGYEAQTPVLDPAEVSVVGPESIVERVKEVRVRLDIGGADGTVTRTITPIPLDAEGQVVSGVTILPDSIAVTQPINLLGGYRYVIVRAVSVGLVANGYRLTNIFVSPVGVVVFSAEPQLVNDLPGYVETQPIDLTDADDDFETLVDLNLPIGVSVVGDPKVLVQVSIAAIESSLAVSLPVEVIGLTPGLEVMVAPATVDVILAGPVPILDTLEPSDIRLVVDVTGYGVGAFQLIPVVDFLPEQVHRVSILPATVEVTITLAPTPTPTLTPAVSPTPSPTPTPTPISTRSP